ncbi:hypothetical protein Aca07nite_60160 [Actinoplanes capillaceus]|uniref:AttH domain-containing protein n=1 Tax=Actinoplanes campanulatus TaxID=113559 RepID=A0ABQ3WR18_9ACTN|nr:lipocalin-like domain-containing protein [Actinoplanes capillaceus]GID48741.1 hypothetical protein Aca07nite_60160 [Actinoplanes capillaceus]
MLAAGAVAAVPDLSGLGPAGSPAAARAATPTPSPTSCDGYTANGYGRTQADYARVGLDADRVEAWEDGFRTAWTNADPHVFEWWYSDFTGDDGTVVSYVIRTRLHDGFEPDQTVADRKPGVSVIITDPDGTNHKVVKTYDWDDFSSSTERCDVRVGPFRFSGDLKTYHMRGTDGEIAVDLTLTSLVKPFRPGTGILFLGDTDKYLAWLAAVPSGRAEGTITVDGKKRAFTGKGYHDHNWGNISFPQYVDHWRWGRGSVGKYAVIGTAMHLREEFDAAFAPVLLVDDTETGERVLASYSTEAITAAESDPRPHPDPAYPKDYYAKVDWTYSDGDDHATLTMTDTDKLITAMQYVTDPTAAQQATLAKLGIDEIWYTRYDTDVVLDLDTSAARAGGTGKGTLENAQFGLSSSPPKG